jgi:hypothetical protein
MPRNFGRSKRRYTLAEIYQALEYLRRQEKEQEAELLKDIGRYVDTYALTIAQRKLPI